MSNFLTQLIDEDIDSRYYRLHERFGYYSDILKCEVWIESGFVYDHESIPIIKGTSNRAGLIHDYLCRFDSIPVVTKQQAASVYFEAMECRDLETGGGFRNWWRRWVKSTAVRIAVGYFHVLSVSASYDEVRDV